MSQSFLGKIPFLGKFADERFLEHRRRSTSAAGIGGCLTAGVLLEYHIFHDRMINWELFSVLIVMVTVKIGMMVWYRVNG